MKASELNEPIFPEAERLEDKNTLVDKQIKIKAYRPMGEGEDKYYIVLAIVDDKLITFGSGKAINDTIEKATQKVGTTQEGNDHYLKEPLEGTVIKKKTQDGKRSYFTIE